MRIVLLRKLAKYMDGVDVSDRQVGDVLDLPAADAHALLAEQWAMLDRRRENPVVSLERRRATDVNASSVNSGEPAPAAGASHVVGDAARVEQA